MRLAELQGLKSANGTINTTTAMPGTLFVVATPIGNLEDITARALRILREVSLIAAEDTRRTARLLARYGIKTSMTSLHEHNEAVKSPQLVERLRRGDDVALVTDAGTPGVSDPGQRLVREAVAARIRVEPIPGPSAVMAALAVSGVDANTFTFLGFPPTRSKARDEWFASIRSYDTIVVFFEAPHRIQSSLEQLRRTVGDCQVVISRELTKVHEETFRGTVSEAAAHFSKPQGEFTIIVDIGQMAKLRPSDLPRAQDLCIEFGVMTNSGRLSRREAVAEIARKYGRSANEIYARIEEAKKSGL
jgi:16S rRNA (cytidine1402-2'-O)-methyltransferase